MHAVDARRPESLHTRGNRLSRPRVPARMGWRNVGLSENGRLSNPYLIVFVGKAVVNGVGRPIQFCYDNDVE